MKNLLLVSISLLLVCCSTVHKSTNGRGSFKYPLEIGAGSIEKVKEIEYQWIEHKYPNGFIITERKWINRRGKHYHKVTIQSAEREKDIFLFEYTLYK